MDRTKKGEQTTLATTLHSEWQKRSIHQRNAYTASGNNWGKSNRNDLKISF